MKVHAGKLEGLVVFVAGLVIFLSTLVANFSGPHDSINYLNQIVEGKHLFHQHHLLYHFTAHLWYALWHPLFPGVRDYYIVESFTAFWGALNVLVIYFFLRKRFSLSILNATLVLSVVVFTYGFWLYSTNVEVYAPPMFFLLCCLFLLTGPRPEKKIFYIALLHSLAILFHQVHVLFVVVVLYKIFTFRSLKAFLIYACTGMAVVGAVYFSIGWWVEGNQSPGAWWQWIMGYTSSDAYWQRPGWDMLMKVFTGFTHAFIGGHFIFQLPWLKEVFAEYAGHSLQDEIFLSQHISSTLAIILSVACLLFAALFIYFHIRFIKNFRRIILRRGTVILPLLLCTLVYSLFFCFWMPEILEFWIFQSILIWLMVLGTAFDYESASWLKPGRLFLLLTLLLWFINWMGSMKWMQRIENDLYYQKVTELQPWLNNADDMVVFQDGWIIKDFVDYFTPVQVFEISIDSAQNEYLDSLIRRQIDEKGRLLIFPDQNNYETGKTAHYLDSLILQYQGRWKVLREKDPKMIELQ